MSRQNGQLSRTNDDDDAMDGCPWPKFGRQSWWSEMMRGRGWPDSRVAGAAGKRYAGDLMRRMMQAAYRLWS
jgi:hypothetical protein